MTDSMVLTLATIESCREILREAISSKLASDKHLQQGQALDVAFVNMVANQVIVPALVAVGAQVTKDLLKDILLKGKDELIRLVGVRIQPKTPETKQAEHDLHGHLEPLGFTADEVERVRKMLDDRVHGR